MTYNPFDAAPATEAAAPFEDAPAPAAAPVAVAERPGATAAPAPEKVVVTLKGGAGFEAPWIVIHASSVDEADAMLDSKLLALMEKTKRAASTFSGGGAPAASAPAQSNGAPAAAAAPPRPADAPADFVFKSGVSAKNGKTWQAWMPPTKGDPRPAIWV